MLLAGRSLGFALCCALGCSSGSGSGGSGGGGSCPDIDLTFPEFSPAQAKNGSSVTVTFGLESGTPVNTCPTTLWLDCGGESTRYFIGYAAGVPQANVVLHCDAATAPVECSYSYEYDSPNGTQGGFGSGPTCEP